MIFFEKIINYLEKKKISKVVSICINCVIVHFIYLSIVNVNDYKPKSRHKIIRDDKEVEKWYFLFIDA